MSKREDDEALRQMREHAAEAVDMVRGRRRADLDADRMFMHAMTRLAEIVGEAAARVSDELRDRTPEIPWADVVGMRNRLVHRYHDVDLTILWETVQDDLPSLVERLDRLLADAESE